MPLYGYEPGLLLHALSGILIDGEWPQTTCAGQALGT